MSYETTHAWTGAILAGLRQALDRHGFCEFLPAILSRRYEPGARHSIAVIGDQALPSIESNGGSAHVNGSDYFYLPVSHCVEKQLVLEHARRVYCLVPCVRLLMDGEDQTGRHLYTFYQLEVEWHTESEDEVFTLSESLLAEMSQDVLQRIVGTPLDTEDARNRLMALQGRPYERIPFANARAEVAAAGGARNPHAAGDLTHAEELALSDSRENPFWLNDYPSGVRDSLYRQKGNDLFATYDLVLPGGFGELATGGLRPASGDEIRAQASSLATQPHPYYADWKERTRIQTGGIGFGVERLVRYCAGAESVCDLLSAHDQGPNAEIRG